MQGAAAAVALHGCAPSAPVDLLHVGVFNRLIAGADSSGSST